ncbi:MAG: endonuclease NucS domain-containing protein [Planctomycetota bacterium]|jgi:hypothetical protein
MLNEQAIFTLKETLNRVSTNSSDEYYRIGAQICNAKKQVLAKYQPIFSSDNLDNLTIDDFKGFLLFKNNWHWDSMHRQGGWMTEDVSKLKEALKLLVNEDLPIKTRLNRLRPSNEEPMVKGLGRAVITAILQVMYPEKYGVLNNTAETGMKKLKLWPDFPRGATFGERYEAVNRVLFDTAKELDIDLWTLDMLWWRVSSTHTPKGITSEDGVSVVADDEETGIQSTEETTSGVSVFALEKYLHEFLVDNWSLTGLSNKWSLLEEDGEIVGSHYYTEEVGEIDLLAKHNSENKWLVIELKRNQTSDSTVGQILRYMSWVRKNLAVNGEKVEGLIICRQIDRKLQYALDGLTDIKCMTYQVQFNLKPITELATDG